MMFYIKFDGNYDIAATTKEIYINKRITRDTMIKIVNSCTPIEIKTEGVLKREISNELSKLNRGNKKLLTEDFIPQTATNADLETIFKKYFDTTQIGNEEVTIADQYIFSNGIDVQLLVNIITSNIKSKKVRFVYNKTFCDKTIYNNLISLLNKNNFQVRFEITQNLHDRYWYSKNGGFLVCASFNTLRKAPTIIKMLNCQELCQIYKYYGV